MEKIRNITPGEILLEEFLKPLKISASGYLRILACLQQEYHKYLKENEG